MVGFWWSRCWAFGTTWFKLIIPVEYQVDNQAPRSPPGRPRSTGIGERDLVSSWLASTLWVDLKGGDYRNIQGQYGKSKRNKP